MKLNDLGNKKIIFITGKGGVGKTTISRGLAHALSSQNKKTLLVEVLPPPPAEQKLNLISKNLWHLPLHSKDCFREYIQLKLKLKTLTSLFLDNRLTQYLEKAAPGLKELVLIGKVWFEKENYDHIVVDMPSTGYAAAMINTPINFAGLFPGGPIHHDCLEMTKTFSDPKTTTFIMATLLEEMPVQETLEFTKKMAALLPENKPNILINRKIIFSEKMDLFYKKNSQVLENDFSANPLAKGFVFLKKITESQIRHQTQLRAEEPLNFPEIPEFVKNTSSELCSWFQEQLQ